MQITVNGEKRRFDGEISVSGLLNALGLPEKKIAVEHNLEIVPKSSYDTHIIFDGDRVEIVHFIGGG